MITDPFEFASRKTSTPVFSPYSSRFSFQTPVTLPSVATVPTTGVESVVLPSTFSSEDVIALSTWSMPFKEIGVPAGIMGLVWGLATW